MGTPGWVTIVQPAMATFEQERGVASGAWQGASLTGGSPMSGAEPLRCWLSRSSITAETTAGLERPKPSAGPNGTPIGWASRYSGGLTRGTAGPRCKPTPPSPSGLALVACQAERHSLSGRRAGRAGRAVLVRRDYDPAARQVARELACALGGKRLVVGRTRWPWWCLRRRRTLCSGGTVLANRDDAARAHRLFWGSTASGRPGGEQGGRCMCGSSSSRKAARRRSARFSMGSRPRWRRARRVTCGATTSPVLRCGICARPARGAAARHPGLTCGRGCAQPAAAGCRTWTNRSARHHRRAQT